MEQGNGIYPTKLAYGEQVQVMLYRQITAFRLEMFEKPTTAK
jgi:hypothetical protein